MCLQKSLHLTIGHETTLRTGEQSDLPGDAGLRLRLRVAKLEGRRGDAVQEGALRGVLGPRAST